MRRRKGGIVFNWWSEGQIGGEIDQQLDLQIMQENFWA